MNDVKEWLKAYNKEQGYPDTENGEELIEILTECGKDVWEGNFYDSRWWRNYTVVTQINDKYIQYEWASANRDESIFDLGWEFNWKTVKFVKPIEKTITVTEYIPE